MRRAARSGRIVAVLIPLALLAFAPLGCASSRGPLASLDELDEHETMPLFWRVEGDRGATLYLLGSVHLGPEEGWRYPPAIEEAFARATAVAVEVDQRDLTPEAQHMLVQRYGMLPPHARLQDRLSPETWETLQRHLATSRIQPMLVQRMQPWMITTLLVMESTQQMGWSTAHSVDADFVERAGERSVVPLESPEYQMALMDSLSPRLQELALLDTLGRFEDIRDYLEVLVDAWRCGNEAALERIVFESYEQDPESQPFFEMLIFRRNYEMALRLKVLLDAEQHAGESVFVVVGAAHLIGDRGIPQLLGEWAYPVSKLDRRALESPLPPQEESVAVDR